MNRTNTVKALIVFCLACIYSFLPASAATVTWENYIPSGCRMANVNNSTKYTGTELSKGVFQFTVQYKYSSSYPNVKPIQWYFIPIENNTLIEALDLIAWGSCSVIDFDNVDVLPGQTYPLYAVDKNYVIDNKMSTFVPVFNGDRTYTVTVDFNTKTVTWDSEDPEITALSLRTAAHTYLANADVIDGKANFSVRVAKDTQFFISNYTGTSGNDCYRSEYFFGSGTAMHPQNFGVKKGQTYTLKRTTPYNTCSSSSNKDCDFMLPRGAYDIEIDVNAGTMSVYPLHSRKEIFPDKLYMHRGYPNANTRYLDTYTATQDEENPGIYTFSSFSSGYANKYYVFFSDDNTTSTKRTLNTTATWLLGASEDGSRRSANYNETIPLYDCEPELLLDGDYNAQFKLLGETTYAVVVDLNNRTVTWKAPQEQPVTLYAYNSNRLVAVGQGTDDDEDGILRMSIRAKRGATVFFSDATSAKEMSSSYNRWIYGSSPAYQPASIDVTDGGTFPLEIVTYQQVYKESTCYFNLNKSYDAIIDLNNKTVQFLDYTGDYLVFPETLYLRRGKSSTNVAATGENGIYNFTLKNTTTGSNQRYGYLFTDKTKADDVLLSSWVLGADENGGAVTPWNDSWDLYDIDPEEAATADEPGCFFPINYNHTYNITVDLKNMTSTWTIADEDVPTTMYMWTTPKNVLSSADSETGVFTFELTTTEETPIYFSSVNTSNKSALTSNGWNYAAGPHHAGVDVEVDMDQTYKTWPGSYFQFYSTSYGPQAGYFVVPEYTDCTITLDINARTVRFSTGRELPEKLNLVAYPFTIQETAESEDGVFEFDYTASNWASAPKLYFTDADRQADATAGAWVLGANRGADDNVAACFNAELPMYAASITDLYAGKRCFQPVHPQTYHITADLNTMTVTWEVTTPDPTSLHVVDGSFLAVTAPTTDILMRYSVIAEEGSPLAFTQVTGGTDNRAAGTWLYGATDAVGAEDVTVTLETDASTLLPMSQTTFLALNSAQCRYLAPGNCDVVLDRGRGTATFSAYTGQYSRPAVIQLVDGSLNVLGSGEGDSEGLYSFKFTLPNDASVALAPSTIDGNNTLLWGSVATGTAPEVTTGTAMDLHRTTRVNLRDASTGFNLAAGRWRCDVDIAAATVTFSPVSQILAKFTKTDGVTELIEGSSLDEIADLIMWVKPYDDITYSDVTFNSEATCCVPVYTTGDKDADGYTAINVHVPFNLRGLGDLTLALEDAEMADGSESEGTVSRMFNSLVDPLKQYSVSPQNQSTVTYIYDTHVTWSSPILTDMRLTSDELSLKLIETETGGSITGINPSVENTTLHMVNEELINAKGTYAIVLPADALTFNEGVDDVGNYAMMIVYYIRESTSAAVVPMDTDNRVTVYDLNGRHVRTGRGVEAIQGLHGIYIVNGVKVIM